MSKNALVILAHPHLNRSVANKAITSELQNSPQIELRNIYDLYPNFYIDVEVEQQKLKQYPLIVLQHPFFWYNMPPLLKMWFDEVLIEGFAYGKNGNELADKHLLLSITTGGSEIAYSNSGLNRLPIANYLEPYVQTAKLCKMKWLEPVVLYSSRKKSSEEVTQHAHFLREKIENLSKGLLT